MRQQLPDFTRPLRRQESEDVLQISICIMPVELGRLDHTHQRRRSFFTAQRAGKQPVFASERPWPYLIFDMVVVYRHRAVIQ